MRGVGWALLGAASSLVACQSNSDRPPVYGDVSVGDAGADAGPVFLGNVGHPPPVSGSGNDSPLVLPVVAPSDDPTTCAQAASVRSYVGCDYWPTVVANGVWSIFDFAVVVANAGTAPATVTITGPENTDQSQVVQPDSLVKFYLPWVSDLKGPDNDACGEALPLATSVLGLGEAFHLVSTLPVSVYQFNALEYAPQGGPSGKDWSTCPGTQTSCADDNAPIGCFSYTNDSSLLLPTTAMTGNYRVAGFPGQDVVNQDLSLSPAMNGYFAITATANNTHVTVNLSSTGAIKPGSSASGIAGTPGGSSFTLLLNQGDVAELAGDDGSAFDVSGTLVQADQPVQVIAGAPCDQIPSADPACDHLEQSVFPAETLGKDYFVTQPTGPLGNVVSHVVRFYGNVDGTQLTYLPEVPPGCPTTLNSGDVVTCGTSDGQYLESQDFEVIGTNDFAVATFMLGGTVVDTLVDTQEDPLAGLGDPSESLIASKEQFRTKYVFLAPTDYTESYIDIVLPQNTTLVLDDMFLNTSRATTIADGYSVLRVPISGVNPDDDGAHVLTSSEPVGLQVLGYGKYTSYQYPGGLNLAQIAPPPVLH